MRRMDPERERFTQVRTTLSARDVARTDLRNLLFVTCPMRKALGAAKWWECVQIAVLQLVTGWRYETNWER